MKKFLNNTVIFLLSMALLINTTQGVLYADDSQDYLVYTGNTNAYHNMFHPTCIFTIYKMRDNKFKGFFSATNLGAYDHSEEVSGRVFAEEEVITCVFSMNYYHSSFIITIYPYEGYARCVSSGSYHFVDFDMTGTKLIKKNSALTLSPINNVLEYNEYDFQMCLELSANAYGKKKSLLNSSNNYIPEDLLNTFKKYNIFTSGIISKNYDDDIANNVSLSISHRDNPYNFGSPDGRRTADMIIVIRGTTDDEWQGNTEITGTSYNDMYNHHNFNQAKESIKDYINDYYEKLKEKEQYDFVNLIITGHSRGAAVSNLYAKDALDRMNGTDLDTIPIFNSVIAYTFATPNVAKHTVGMEEYNIYNFEIYEDLIPTVPLTLPTEGWNYWKFGKTYNISAKKLSSILSYQKSALINMFTVSDINNAFSKWNSIEEYYNKILYGNIVTGVDNNGFAIFESRETTLYNVLHDITGLSIMSNSKIRNEQAKLELRKKAAIYPDLARLFTSAANNAISIKNAHHFDTYKSIMSNCTIEDFDRYTYDDCINDLRFNCAFNTPIVLNMDIDSNVEFNINESSKLLHFYSFNDNSNIIEWDLDDPSTWEGITWNADGNVESIDLSFKNLSGELDLSGFSSLKSLDLCGNEITGVTLSNCSSLEEIDCSFNKLTSLDLSDCTSLTSVTCCYNYLDTHEGGTLYNTLDNLMFDDIYVNYYPQSVPDNATFNTTELNALKTFANTDNNESVLDWLDDDGNIDTEKLQKNVLFEYDGSNYRVVAIDVSESDVSGALNLTSLSLLQEVYCENTKITSLNVNGCTKLETLQCDGCDINTLTLPNNAADKNTPLYDVSCEYNYIDTSIFTPTIVEYVNFKAGANLEYENQKGDSSALQAALSFANKLEEKDYSASTYEILKELLDECNYYNFDNLYLTQDDIDSLISDILTAVYNLKAYFKVDLSSPNGNMNIEYAEPDLSNDNSPIELPYLDDEEVSVDNALCSLLYGTRITLYVTPKEGYSFVGWYDTTNNRYLSRSSQYSFKVDSNVNLKAVIVPDGSATLTFSNYSNWIAGTVTKTTLEWAEITTINDLLPDVPYRYGYSNGRWVYDESDVIAKLQAGEDVTVGAEYDNDNISLPTPRTATDKPALDLYYSFDEDNSVGSFVMASGFPENIQVESIGMAFYYRSASVFDPTDNFTLLLNNKMLVSRFNAEELDDIYITNIKNMSATNNWSARGFVTYYDTNGNLVTEYSNQVNIINKNSC